MNLLILTDINACDPLPPLGGLIRAPKPLTALQLRDIQIADFEKGDHTKAVEAAEPELPEGVWDAGPGIYKAQCRSCQRDYELCYDVQDFTEDGNYCGGSDRCIP